MNVTSDSSISSTLSQAGPDILTVTITRYTTAAGVVILIYDCLLTIDDEVSVRYTWKWLLLILPITLQIRLVWPGPLTVAKLLYYFNRYISIAGIIASNHRTSLYKSIIRF